MLHLTDYLLSYLSLPTYISVRTKLASLLLRYYKKTYSVWTSNPKINLNMMMMMMT